MKKIVKVLEWISFGIIISFREIAKALMGLGAIFVGFGFFCINIEIIPEYAGDLFIWLFDFLTPHPLGIFVFIVLSGVIVVSYVILFMGLIRCFGWLFDSFLFNIIDKDEKEGRKLNDKR